NAELAIRHDLDRAAIRLTLDPGGHGEPGAVAAHSLEGHVHAIDAQAREPVEVLAADRRGSAGDKLAYARDLDSRVGCRLLDRCLRILRPEVGRSRRVTGRDLERRPQRDDGASP